MTRRPFWWLAIPACLGACLSDESISSLDEEGKTSVAGENGGASALLAPPPGGIVDTQPSSGWTEGSFAVNHNGAAEYHIPLWVPDGRGGLQPELALYYNSQAGNDLVGVGWSLSAGLSTITPCARTLARDGRIENPGFWQGTDAYCLDGERLRPTDPEWSADQDYRTERDSFARIRAHSPPESNPLPTPDSFEVWTKDGKILTYDTRIQAFGLIRQDREDPSFAESIERVTTAWALTRIEDRNGNAIHIEYETIENPQDRWSVEVVPHAITYGPDRRLEFGYEGRSDAVRSFRPGDDEVTSGGVHSVLDRRLSTIRTLAGTQLLREVSLQYANSFTTGRSQLRTVTECDGAAEPVCLNALEFDWSLAFTNTFEVIDTDVTDVARAATGKRYYIPGDINGDGRDDLLYRCPRPCWRWRCCCRCTRACPTPRPWR